MVILKRCNNKTLAALLHMETLGFFKIKIEKIKGVWDNFFTYEILGFSKIKIEENKGVWDNFF